MRRGKQIAQGSHSSLAFLTSKLRGPLGAQPAIYHKFHHRDIDLTDEENEWLEDSYAKICVGIDSEAKLLELHERAKEAGLTSHLIQDNGTTEFHGVPTYTCLCIGPHYVEKIDRLTGHLKLL